MRFIKLVVVGILLWSAQAANGQSIWQAQFHSIRLVVQGANLSQVSNTSRLWMSIPERSVDSLGLHVERTGDSLLLENKMYGYLIKARINNDQNVSGVIRQGSGATYNITLKPVESIQPVSFPQHPRAPYPYINEDVVFEGANTGLQYGATITIPKKKKHYPVAVLITGTGQQERNYSYAGHQLFTVLADHLAKNGIASIRVDDRGIGATTGDFETATTGDFVEDTKEAIAYLKRRKGIDTSFIGVIGHSEGGIIASMIAAQEKDVKFMISLSGVGVDGLTILKLQNEAILKSYNIPDSVVSKHMELYDKFFKVVYHSSDNQSLDSALRSTMKQWMSMQDSATLEAMKLLDGRDESLLYRYGRDAKKPWYQYMIHYDPQNYLPVITIPVLAINGGSDIMVPAKENLENFKRLLINTSDVTVKEYPGLNHMYQHCKTCLSAEMSDIEEVFAPEVLSDIGKWINKRYQGRKRQK